MAEEVIECRRLSYENANVSILIFPNRHAFASIGADIVIKAQRAIQSLKVKLPGGGGY